MSPDNTIDVARVVRERDLYLPLLQLGWHETVDPFLEEALTLIADVVGARIAYLELSDDEAGAGPMRWSARSA